MKDYNFFGKHKCAKWKSNSSNGDIVHNTLCRVNKAVILKQNVLTSDPSLYYGYATFRKFFGKFLITKTEIHTEETWRNVVDGINMLKQDLFCGECKWFHDDDKLCFKNNSKEEVNEWDKACERYED